MIQSWQQDFPRLVGEIAIEFELRETGHLVSVYTVDYGAVPCLAGIFPFYLLPERFQIITVENHLMGHIAESAVGIPANQPLHIVEVWLMMFAALIENALVVACHERVRAEQYMIGINCNEIIGLSYGARQFEQLLKEPSATVTLFASNQEIDIIGAVTQHRPFLDKGYVIFTAEFRNYPVFAVGYDIYAGNIVIYIPA